MMNTKENSIIIGKNDEIGNIWRVTDKLGEGGCGIVFRVQNLKVLNDKSFFKNVTKLV